MNIHIMGVVILYLKIPISGLNCISGNDTDKLDKQNRKYQCKTIYFSYLIFYSKMLQPTQNKQNKKYYLTELVDSENGLWSK